MRQENYRPEHGNDPDPPKMDPILEAGCSVGCGIVVLSAAIAVAIRVLRWGFGQ